jgi:osmoprotectant transport system ATP-binding protein
LDCRRVSAGQRVQVGDLVLGGSLAGPDASLRTALDAALSSPSGRGVAVDGNSAVLGTVTARDVLAAIEQAGVEDSIDTSTDTSAFLRKAGTAGAAS